MTLFVASPNTEVHVLALLDADEAPSHGGAVLDEHAKSEYRARIDELEGAAADADRDGDNARASRARDELAQLAEPLAGAVARRAIDALHRTSRARASARNDV